jgi:hypothetical protein
MKSTKFFPPYFKKGKLNKCSLKTTFQNFAGVYIIKNLKDEVLYVGYSSNNLYRTIYRHYQKWEDEQKRSTYGKYSTKIRVIKTTNLQAPRVERYLIQKLKPRDNENGYESEEIKPINLKEINYFTSGESFEDDYPF